MVQRPRPDLRGGCAAMRIPTVTITAGRKSFWKRARSGSPATPGEVKGLRQEMRDLKELVAELSLENRLLKKNMIGHGGDEE